MSNKKNNKIVIMCDCHNTLMNSNEAWVEAFSEFLGNEKKEEISLWLYGKKPRRELAKKYNIRFEDVENSAGKYLKRNEGLKLDDCAFTNITQDHLDFYKTIYNYLKAKLKILDYLDDDKYILLNSDDENSKYFMNHLCKTY